jgi:hypothetical protein
MIVKFCQKVKAYLLSNFGCPLLVFLCISISLSDIKADEKRSYLGEITLIGGHLLLSIIEQSYRH